MATMKIISKDMRVGNDGKILTLSENYAVKKEMVSLLLDIINGEIPFLNYGQEFKSQLFKGIDEDILKMIVLNFVYKVRNSFGLIISSYTTYIENSKMMVEFKLENNEIIKFEV